MAKIQVSTKINNENVEYLCEPHDTMLNVLRNQLNLTGSKESCGSGDCGSCSIILDGELVCSCLMLAAEAEGSSIETIEVFVQRWNVLFVSLYTTSFSVDRSKVVT